MTAPACPSCRKQAPTPRYRPFCSARCADIDLHRWLVGAYAIPMQDGRDFAESDAAGDPEEPSRSSSSHSVLGDDTFETE